ncbi:hypothetical protein CASFOL_025453 [Castilleja foliolosa]|uniref:TF-B3 domain-containing protein n=1 Tax=Castilleja foliolosa TaxID=1961234 RepID=A0ABD3CTG0_9LAMI
MTVSTMKNDSKRIPISSPQHKLNQRTWEKKKKLAMDRLIGLTDSKIDEMPEQKESVKIVDKRTICCAPKKKKAIVNLINNCDVFLTPATERAQQIQHNLSPNSPSFIKNMLKSHVSGGFWLGLPKQFCDDHLPKCDVTVVLVCENEIEHDTKYLVDKNGLSGRWRAFSIAHELVEGDVLVFELLKPCKFKVHIVRESELKTEEHSAARCLLTLHAQQIQTERMEEDKPDESLAPKCLKLAPLDRHNKKKRKLIVASDDDEEDDEPGPVPLDDHNKNKRKLILANEDDDETGPDGGISFSESLVHFIDVKCFDEFKIQVDGLILDSEISKHLRKKYYELCVSQNNFLHENLAKGINSKLAAGIILETINIADAIRAAKHSSSLTDLKSYSRTLKAFEDLGMSVGFLRARIDKLLGLSNEFRAAIESKKNELNAAEDEMRGLKTKLTGVKMLMEKLVGEIYGLKVKNEELEVVFTDVADTPW